MKNLYPDFYFRSAAELSGEFFLSRGITHVVFDIDDTLVAHGKREATDEVRALLRSFSDAGLTLALISNSKGDRAEVFNRSLDEKLFAIGCAKKPMKRALAPFFARFKVRPKNVAFVGDQLLTDVWLCKKWGILSVLVEPILPYENAFFYFKRALEKPILAAYFKKTEQQNRTEED